MRDLGQAAMPRSPGLLGGCTVRGESGTVIEPDGTSKRGCVQEKVEKSGRLGKGLGLGWTGCFRDGGSGKLKEPTDMYNARRRGERFGEWVCILRLSMMMVLVLCWHVQVLYTMENGPRGDEVLFQDSAQQSSAFPWRMVLLMLGTVHLGRILCSWFQATLPDQHTGRQTKKSQTVLVCSCGTCCSMSQLAFQLPSSRCSVSWNFPPDASSLKQCPVSKHESPGSQPALDALTCRPMAVEPDPRVCGIGSGKQYPYFGRQLVGA
jgi:hypothetical protein